jgi:hypothetical protein
MQMDGPTSIIITGPNDEINTHPSALADGRRRLRYRRHYGSGNCDSHHPQAFASRDVGFRRGCLSFGLTLLNLALDPTVCQGFSGFVTPRVAFD